MGVTVCTKLKMEQGLP